MVETNEIYIEMARNGFNLRSLARSMGMSENALRYKIKGRRPFNTNEIHSMCELLHITDCSRKAEIFLPN